MINVGSEKGFYFSNPRDYLDGKINDVKSIAYSAYTISRSEAIYREEVFGWGATRFTFYDCDSNISMTKEAFAKIITENFADFDYPFFVQKLKPSITWKNKSTVFSTEDLGLYEQLLNQSNDMSYVVETFKEHTIHTKTSKIINGEILTSVKDINGNICEVGDEVYYSKACGRIDTGIITKFTDISIFVDDYCLGKVVENDILLKKKKTS